MTEKRAESSVKKPLPPLFTFLNAGNSGMAATCVVHPMDVIKNRIQVQKGRTSVGSVIKSIYKNEGILKFYTGLSAGLVRQATYTTVRLGIYNQLQEHWKQKYATKPGFGILALMAGTAGALGAFVGTPAEVALVRMTADGRLPKDQRRNYRNVFHAFGKIGKEEGLTALWRGSVATMGRAIVVNVSQLATYSQAKFLIASKMHLAEGVGLHFCASMLSGFLTTFNSMPFDVTKTRIQTLKSTGKLPGMVSMMLSIAKTEGIPALWKGFLPTYCRASHKLAKYILILARRDVHTEEIYDCKICERAKPDTFPVSEQGAWHIFVSDEVCVAPSHVASFDSATRISLLATITECDFDIFVHKNM